MPYGINQSNLYGVRGNSAMGGDGMGIRNRSGEQYNSASGNPNVPVYNTPGGTGGYNQLASYMPRFGTGAAQPQGWNTTQLQQNTAAPPTDARLALAQRAQQAQGYANLAGSMPGQTAAPAQGYATPMPKFSLPSWGNQMQQNYAPQAQPVPAAMPQRMQMPQFRYR